MTVPKNKKDSYYWETSIEADYNQKLVYKLSLIFKDDLQQEEYILPLHLPDTTFNRTVIATMFAVGVKRALANATVTLSEKPRPEALAKVRELFDKIASGDYEFKERKAEPIKVNISTPQLVYWLLTYKGLTEKEILTLREEDFEEDWLKASHRREIGVEYSYMDNREEFLQKSKPLVAKIKTIRRALNSKALREKRFKEEIKAGSFRELD